MRMSRRGFTLLELLSALSLFLMISLLLWGIVGREIRLLREISMKNELFDKGEVTEHILKHRLEKTIRPIYIRDAGGRLEKYEDFTGGAIQVFFFAEKKYNRLNKKYNENFQAFHFKEKSKKLFHRENIPSLLISPDSIGGYEAVADVERFELYKEEKGLRFLIEFSEGDFRYEREVFVYPEE